MTNEELLRIIDQAADEEWEELDLSGQGLTELPGAIGKLTKLKTLICTNEFSSNKLTKLPPEIGQLTSLKTLDISSNNISEIPYTVSGLSHLQHLIIAHNFLNDFPPGFEQLTSLKTLDISSNNITRIPYTLKTLSQLQHLIIANNLFTEFPPELSRLISLKKIHFSDNNIEELSPEIGELLFLKQLILSNNKITKIAPEIGRLVCLEELDLSGNKLTNLPSEMGKLTNLKILTLGNRLESNYGFQDGFIGNHITKLPTEIGQLTSLKELDCSYNQLSNLPSEISQLTSLRELYLSDNKLSILPLEIVQLTSLQSLKISYNQLSDLPPEIKQLKSLQSLKISYNQLSSLTPEIKQLKSLEELELSYNQLSDLPPEIEELKSLQSLNLSYNQLSNLPPEIRKLKSLQSLNFSYNQLSNLPPEIGQLKSLQSLNFSYNQLSNLPPEIGELKSLQFVNFYNNKLSSLPPEIGQLKQLQKLDLRQNPVPIPPEFLGGEEQWQAPGDVQEILDFYFRVQDPNETEPLYEAKLLIIGEGGAGKTSLAKKILDENYELNSEEKSTEGIDVIQWKIPLSNGKEFRVNIWDFGGQEIYHQTHQFFLTERSLYLLVADTRPENTNFYWWLKVAELLSGQSPIFIIKNEKQDRQCLVNAPQLRSEFPNLKEVFSTNLATNRGLQEIKQAIEFSITHLPHVGDASPLPKIWVRVRSALENDSRNYITQTQYFELCEINQLRDIQDMLRLSRYLHDLGICLHFQDDPTLKHYVILKPEWGTTAVYKVLDNQTVIGNLGCFSQENLSDIWKDRDYAQMRQELLQLMMRFKLCYPIPNRPQEYIAPQLLDYNSPEYDWNNSHNLILRYEYEFMPKGILTRFIVEIHPWIEQQQLVWRNGVVLFKDSTRAEVIENYNQKEIKVRISGGRKKELLAVINYELEKIHLSFEGLKYQTLVPCNCSLCDGSDKPYAYSLEDLHRRLHKGRLQVECGFSYEMVDVRRLIDDVNLPLRQEYGEPKTIKATPLQQELESDRVNNYYLQGATIYGFAPEAQSSPITSGGTVQDNTIANTLNKPQSSNVTNNTFNAPVGAVSSTLNDNAKAIGQYNEAQSQDLTEAAAQIQALLDQLSQTYPTKTSKQKMAIAVEAMDVIEQDSSLTQRLLSAVKAGSLAAIESMLNHPAASFVIAAIEDLNED